VSNPPSATEMLRLLDSLAAAIRDFSGREEKLNGDYRSRSAAERDQFESRIRQHEAAAAARLADAESGSAAAQAACQSGFERRKIRINRAHNAVRKGVMGDISQDEEQRKYKIQESALRAERQRDTDLANAAAVLGQFQQELAETREGFVRLEQASLKAFRGYRQFRRMLAHEKSGPEPDLAPDENQLLEELRGLQAATGEELDRFRKFFWPQWFRFLSIWLATVLLLGFGATVLVLEGAGVSAVSRGHAAIALIALAAVWAVYFHGRRVAGPAAGAIAGKLGRARRLHDACFEQAGLHHQREQRRILAEFENTNRVLNQRWKQTVKGALDLRGVRPMEVDERAKRLYGINEKLQRAQLERIERDHAVTTSRLRGEAAAQARQLAEPHAAQQAKLESDYQAGWKSLEAEWKKCVEPIFHTIRLADEAAGKLFPEWQSSAWEKWALPEEFKNAAKFGRLEVNVRELAETLPKDKRLALPGPPVFSVPLALAYPRDGSLLFETAKTGEPEAIATINNIIFRLLSTTPPGKLSFTIFDPVGLGENFAALMHLADYEESSINSRIWTQTNQFEEKLAELNEHMEKVIQMYLRNEYATITEYNAQAGTIAEKYHFLVIASFPVNFSDTAARRLRNIAASGARCGVYTLIHWDQRHALPHDFVPDELRQNSVGLIRAESGVRFSAWRRPGTHVFLDPPPSPEIATRFLHGVGKSSKDSNRVEVPFAQVAPPESEVWTQDTTEELQVPIGRSGATKLQRLEIGKATRQHALIAGKTGSGKSTLFHVIITNLSLWCSPEQVEFYLVDFKKGVEFKCYASRRLPHAKVVAIESDRQFGLSVLQRVDEELRRRGDLFRQLGVQDLAGYKKAGGVEPMPRSLLIIDEFQEFFTEEDRVSQSAAVLLDRIVRQGRAFGIHVLLGSQTLGGAYTLARATIGQMVIRIALQCNEADAYLIMDQDNPAPRLLTRPGEGIYNDTAGSIGGNSPFQTVWLPEDERDRTLAKVRARADAQDGRYPGPFVFEGNAPADVRENALLRSVLEAKATQTPAQARTWLGSPNAIKGPTEAVFRRQSGNHLLIVGQSEERSATILAIALVSLAAHYPKGAARFVLLDSTPPGFPHRDLLQQIVRVIPHEVVQVNNSTLAEAMSGLAEDLKRRSGDDTAEAPESFVLIQGLQNYKKLRQEDEFSFSGSAGGEGAQPAAVLQSLISDGPARGVHVIATCDTYNNVNRFLGRKALSEFEMRVLFQMSASDSASLVDAPDASTLGLHRALYYNDREGYTETFRPYALPGNDWIEQITQLIRR
jgi:DNA segregation ATPase FtsK/SpoIIIE, S-DNA-T family